MLSRRTYLRGTLGVGVVSLAGCAGEDDDLPDPETPARELLPDTDEWPLREAVPQEPGLQASDDAVRGFWDGSAGEYVMEIVRFTGRGGRVTGQERAERAANGVYSVWDLSLSHGVFTYAVDCPDPDGGRALLAASPPLYEPLVDAKT